MGKLKEMMIAAYEDYEDAAEYEFYMWMEEEKRREEACRRLSPNSFREFHVSEINPASGNKKD